MSLQTKRLFVYSEWMHRDAILRLSQHRYDCCVSFEYCDFFFGFV